MENKQKYIRLKEYDEIIIFPTLVGHADFKHLNPISAGFCYIYDNSVRCFGNSVGLGIESLDDDSFMATKQIFGWQAAKQIKNK